MKRHKLFIALVVLAFTFGWLSVRWDMVAHALTLSGTARSMIVQVMDSNGNILDGVHSAISGISYPNMIVQVMNSTGTILDNFGITLPGGGVSASIPQTSWDFVSGAGKSLSVPAGATRLIACLSAGGGGGGAATSGGAVALSGGSGGSGAYYCALISGAALALPITYSVGAAGSAGTCGAAPTGAGNGGSSSITVNGVLLGTAGGGGLGNTASTTVEGTAGSGGSAATFKNGIFPTLTVQANISTAGTGGNTGTGDNYVAQGAGGGSPGGLPAAVTSGGVCDATFPATAGGVGSAQFTFYFQ